MKSRMLEGAEEGEGGKDKEGECLRDVAAGELRDQ